MTFPNKLMCMANNSTQVLHYLHFRRFVENTAAGLTKYIGGSMGTWPRFRFAYLVRTGVGFKRSQEQWWLCGRIFAFTETSFSATYPEPKIVAVFAVIFIIQLSFSAVRSEHVQRLCHLRLPSVPFHTINSVWRSSWLDLRPSGGLWICLKNGRSKYWWAYFNVTDIPRQPITVYWVPGFYQCSNLNLYLYAINMK